MPPRRPLPRRSLVALALSLALHAVVLVLLVRGAPVKPPPAPKPQPIRVVWLDAKDVPAPLVTPAPAQAVPVPAQVVKRATQRPRPAVVQVAPKPQPNLAPRGADDAPPGGSEVAATDGNGAGAAGEGGDRPRGLATLLPRADLLPMPEGAAPPRGRTLHPEDMPTPAELRAEEAVRVADRTEGWMHETLARARVDVGSVDPYLTDLRHELTKRLEDAPNFTEPNGLKDLGKTLVKSYATAAGNYGSTGTPYDLPPGWREDTEMPSQLKEAVAAGSPQAKELASMLHAGARFREFGEGRMGAQLYAVVEIRQQPTGVVETMTLLTSSGVPLFDDWVMGRAHTAVDSLGPRDGGLRPLRSVWGFSGKVTYKRSMRDLKLKDDWWYLAVAGASSLMTGSFDEVTGQVDYIDLRHPHYECRVKLLAQY